MTYPPTSLYEVGLLTCVPHSGLAGNFSALFHRWFGVLFTLLYGIFRTALQVKVAAFNTLVSRTYCLLNHYFLLLCIDPALRVLGGNRNHAFPRGKRWHKVMKSAIPPNYRNLMAVNHDSRSRFGLSS